MTGSGNNGHEDADVKAEDIEHLKELRTRRGNYKGAITRLEQWIKEAAGDVHDVEAREEMLMIHYNSFRQIQEDIEKIKPAEVSERTSMDARICTAKASLRRLRHQKAIEAGVNLNASSTSHDPLNATLNQSAIPPSQIPINVQVTAPTEVPLPNLKKFSGHDYLEYPIFKNAFVALVESAGVRTMSKIKKFSILRDSLEGRAYEAIQHLQLTDENYDKALDILEVRFMKQRLIFDSLVKRLFDLPRVSSSDSLRKLVDVIEANLNALEGLPATFGEIGFGLLIHHVLSKVDGQTLFKWNEISSTKPTILPDWEELKAFLEGRANMMESIAFLNPKRDDKARINPVKKSYAAIQSSCMCTKNCSTISDCLEFTKVTPNERYTWVKNNNHCVKCLQKTPHDVNCKTIRCQVCKGRHNTILHFGDSKPPSPPGGAGSAVNNQKMTLNVNNQGSVDKLQILGTAMIKLKARNGEWIPIRVLIDGGSMVHLITKRAAAKLQLKMKKQSAPVIGLFGSNEIRESTDLELRSIDNAFTENLSALVLPEFNHVHPTNRLDQGRFSIPKNICLADPTFHQPQRVDMIIGVGLAYKILMVGQIQIDENMLLQKTRFGWLVVGEYNSNCTNANKLSFTAFSSTCNDYNLEEYLQKFWDVERVPVPKPNWSKSEWFCEEHFRTHTTRADDGKFIVKLPFMTSPERLGKSYQPAMAQLLSLERKLIREPELGKLYRDFMTEYEELKHMQAVESDDVTEYNYLPHHGVLRPSSTTTKCRVVFNASYITSSGVSLNDLMPNGPTIQPSLFDILLRFRYQKIILSGDICKMYRQIWVHPEDQRYQCILWRDNPNQPPKTYKLKTVTYGTTSAPFLSIRVLDELANNLALDYPIGAQILKHDFYVDNMMSGAKTVGDSLKQYQQVSDILRTAGMEMKKWYTNSLEVRKIIPQEDQEKMLKIGEDEVTKSLGLTLNLDSDEFVFTCIIDEENGKWTKRKVVSQVAKIFDPLGFYGAAVIKLKIFVQHLWKLSIDWDESLPQQTLTVWLRLINELPQLRKYKIPRWVHLDDDEVASTQLHCFADASGEAYGTVFFLRHVFINGTVLVQFLVSKSKVAPLKKLTLARLELLGALLLSELYAIVMPTLMNRIKEVFCWLDSQVALTWVVNSPHRYDDFIAARTTKIQERTVGCQWRHIQGIENPADVISRGVSPATLLNRHEWLNGPQLLYRQPSDWPVQSSANVSDDDSCYEKRKIKFSMSITTEPDLVAKCKFVGSVEKVQRTFAYVARYLTASQLQCNPDTQQLSAVELEGGLKLAVKIIQIHQFPNEYEALKKGNDIARKSRLIQLAPFIDNDGVIRVGGRLKNAIDMTYDERHPMLLPQRHPFTESIFFYYHWKTLHTGPQALLAAVRRKFWPLGGRVLANKTYRKCFPCQRFQRKTFQQVMADLPPERVQLFEKCFEVTGVDLCGPFTVKHHGRGTQRTTMHVAVFVCFRTRAVQLQHVMGTDTDSAINAIIRFISRAGTPKIFWSDNGTNFQASNTILQGIDWGRVDNWCRNTHKIQWKFIPARSPHHGGLWEAAVKSAKKHLYKVMQNTVLHQDAFITLLSMVEAILNNRPITPLSINPQDGQPLTPAHFLIGGPILQLPDPTPALLTSTQKNLVASWLHINEIKQHWLKKWLTEVRQNWQHRLKWHSGSNDIQVGRTVMMVDKSKSPYAWSTAVVTKVFPGRDNRVRVVEVSTKIGDEQKSLLRAVTELVPIITEAEDNIHQATLPSTELNLATDSMGPGCLKLIEN